jgi:ABC-2 type transport system ATP-binding protein
MTAIEVRELSKAYGATVALDRVSFRIEPGELVGFLGKNGAGKSTTMRILAGSLAATTGTATIGGLDVEQHAHQVKAMVGYLPEFPPLYVDMTVRQYLRYAARLRGVSAPTEAVAQTLARVGLDPVAHRLIGHLSKGYRQRVGIAQAIVHQPKVLILDEPMSGLDPEQRRDIRNLVAELASGETTVILSTHVLPEIEGVCDRVIVLHEGRVVAQDAVATLAGPTTRIHLQVARPEPALEERLRAEASVRSVQVAADGKILITADVDAREQIARIAVEYGLLELRRREDLEDAFLRLVGATEERP